MSFGPNMGMHRTDGATRQAEGDLGMIMKSGTNLQFTDLAPGARAPLVGAFHDSNLLQAYSDN